MAQKGISVFFEGRRLLFLFVLSLLLILIQVFAGKTFRGDFTGLYGNPIVSKRAKTWKLLGHLYNSDNSAWLVGGDLNIVLRSSEKLGGAQVK